MTTSAGDVSIWDEIPEMSSAGRTSPFQELGVTGPKRVSGIIDEEFLPALRGRKAVQVYKEMSQNDSMVGALLFAVDRLLREVKWEVTPSDQTPEGAKAAEFLESCMDDMSHSWDDFISEALSCLVYGWSWHEIVYKKRMGPWEKSSKKKSKYTDGLIGWRKFPIRSQETWLRWVFDKQGGIKALVQLSPPHYQTTVIPVEKSLLFRTSVQKGNPEGQSILRTGYRSWYLKKRLEEFEAIGVERDLAGMPVARVPAEFLKAKQGTDQYKTVQAFRKMVRGVRRDENEGLIIPTQYDPDTKQPLFDFELMTSGGSRQFDTNAIITRYEQRILMTVLADFILVGHESTGSYSLHTDKTGIFRAALNAITGAIAEVLNRHAVPRLFEINGWKPDELPKFSPNNVDPPDLTQLAAFISSTSSAGMQWFPDPELEKFVRDIARLPEMTDETLEFKRQTQMQTMAMEQAGSQMEMLGMAQKAQLAAEGMSPEQAQMAAETPLPEQQQTQAGAEMEGEAVRQHHPVTQEMKAEEAAAGEQQFKQQEQSKGKDHERQIAVERLKARTKDKAAATGTKAPVKKKPPKK